MNTLKPLLIVAVLAGIGYGVYVRINSGHDSPPPGVADGWDTVPKVQLPESAPPGGLPSFGPGGGPGNSAVAPAMGGSRGMPPAGATSGAPEMAPPFGAPQGGNGQIAAGRDHAAPPFADPAGAPPIGSDPAMPDRSGRGEPRQAAPSYDPAAMPPQGAPPVNPVRNPVNRDYAEHPADPYRGAPEISAPPAGSLGTGFNAAMESARRELEAGQMASALQQLSSWYEDPRLTPSEQQQLTQVLDQVAGTVVYSTQHLLEPPYEVQPGERLEDISERYSVPWQLLAKINGLDDPQNLRPGERLKMVRGPFSAIISLEKRELTLLLNGSYAGRFKVGIGAEHPLQEGNYAVSDKVVNPVYHGRDRAIDAGNPSNPLGDRWIGLGNELGIHGTNRPENIGRTDLPGSISLNPRDVEDVYDILSVGSKVIVRR